MKLSKKKSESGRLEVTYHKNGIIKTIAHLNKAGNKNGEYKEFYDNKKLKIKANYYKNKLNGLYEEYDINRNKIKEIMYKNGKEIPMNKK